MEMFAVFVLLAGRESFIKLNVGEFSTRARCELVRDALFKWRNRNNVAVADVEPIEPAPDDEGFARPYLGLGDGTGGVIVRTKCAPSSLP